MKKTHSWPNWGEHQAHCKCSNCGAIYVFELSNWMGVQSFERLPLIFKRPFRGKTLWALNGDHLNYLEKVIKASLREKAVYNGRRISLTRLMPFNLPSWLLSAKNRDDILNLIQSMKLE